MEFNVSNITNYPQQSFDFMNIMSTNHNYNCIYSYNWNILSYFCTFRK